MDTTKMAIRNRVHSVKPSRRQVTFGTFGFASEHLTIKSDQPSPISGDQIGVYVFRADWHSFLLDQLTSITIHLPMSFSAKRRISDRFWTAGLEKLRCFASLNMTAGKIGRICGMPTNVLGTELKCCCRDPMTGFYRDGYCRTGPEDVGQHTVCVQVTEEFLD